MAQRWFNFARGLTATFAVFGACLLGLTWAGLRQGALQLPGVRVDGAPLPARALRAEYLLQRAQVWEQQPVSLQVGYHELRVRRGELGFALATQAVAKHLRDLEASPNPFVVLRALCVGLFGAGHDLRLVPRLRDGAALARHLERIREQVERLPWPGTRAPDGAWIEGVPGEAFDSELARGVIISGLARGATKLALPTVVTPPPRASAERVGANVSDALTVLMRAQDTRFTAGTGRATNIALAAAKLDRVVIPAGGRLSFNALVGKRERARGFAPALELVGGELVEGIGGGVCQVAGTLHAAAFFAGLSIEEYHAHSRLNRLAYLPPGLDAMVAWPEATSDVEQTRDMRLRNPYPFGILIRAQVLPAQSDQILRVSLYGAARPYPVDYNFRELARTAAQTIVRPNAALGYGEVRELQAGREGLAILRERALYTPLGRVHEETRVEYPATPRIVEVGTLPANREKPAAAARSRKRAARLQL